MTLVDDLRMFARFAGGLWSFLRHPISLDEARAIVRRRLAEREGQFVRLVERGIFGHPRSPYLPLLELAGCQLGDLRQMVRDRGVEDTLRALRGAGVYISFEEFKGREPLVRDGRVIPLLPRDFDNPYLRRHYESETGGSTGAGTRVAHELDHLAALAPPMMLTCDIHGVLDVPTAIWRGILPDGSGINNVLRAAHCGRPPDKWFSPVGPSHLRPSLKHLLATYYTVVVGRLFGARLPWPEVVPIDRAGVVARWAAEQLARRGACLVCAPVSRALRVCVAAREAGLDLTGATFMIAGEPPTPAKVEGITRTGARCFPTYGLAETGRIAMGCGRPADANDLHLLTDAFALIPWPRRVLPGSDLEVPAFNLTSLLSTTPKILLNVEIDDYGVIEQRRCGCPLEAIGYTQHLREIRSFRKLTGEGVTLLGSDMLRILDEVLPARFGGSPLDYQLMEAEDEQGFTRLDLVVSPRIGLRDEGAVLEAVMQALRESSVMADSARAIWDQARTLRIKRMEPVWTARGKLMPLHLARRPGAAPPAGDTAPARGDR
jgi:hypothetical protein